MRGIPNKRQNAHSEKIIAVTMETRGDVWIGLKEGKGDGKMGKGEKGELVICQAEQEVGG